MRTNLTFPAASRDRFLSKREFCMAKGMTMKHSLMLLWRHRCLIHFLQEEWKCLVDLMASCCMLNWVFTFSPPLKPIAYPVTKIRLWIIRARPNFYIISDNPNVSLGSVGYSFYTHRFALKDDYHEKWMDMLTYTPSTIWGLYQKLPSFLPDKIKSFKKTFLAMLHIVGLLLQWIQTLQSLDPTLEVPSVMNNLVSDTLEYSQVVSLS